MLSAPPTAHVCLAPPLPLGLRSDRVATFSMIGAPQLGCLEVLLREGGADVDARDAWGETLIIWLARFGSRARCSCRYDDEEEKAARDLLVSAGARTSGVFNNHGYTPLMMAASHNNTRFAPFLIEEAGAPVDERSPSDGYTALHRCEGAEMVALLLDAGAAVDTGADDGRTPLFAFVSASGMAATRLLLDRGASVDVIDKYGSTPLIEACGGGGYWLRDEHWPLFQKILRRSSSKTRRARGMTDESESYWRGGSSTGSRRPRQKTYACMSGAAARWPSCWRPARRCCRRTRPACSRSRRR